MDEIWMEYEWNMDSIYINHWKSREIQKNPEKSGEISLRMWSVKFTSESKYEKVTSEVRKKNVCPGKK